MAWWEGKVVDVLQNLEPGEIERILSTAFSQISHEQFMAATRAVKIEAARRGLLKVSTSA